MSGVSPFICQRGPHEGHTRRRKDGSRSKATRPALAGKQVIMRSMLPFMGIVTVLTACTNASDDTKLVTAAGLTVMTGSLAVITVVGMDTLTDSASIHRLQPEPDGGSVAFTFADPAKGITSGLGLVNLSGTAAAHLAWPDSVTSFWWSGPHQLSFTAGTGHGVRVVVDAHAARLEAIEATDTRGGPSGVSVTNDRNAAALSRARAFIDSVRVQPGGTPQESALRYRADSIIIAPGDTFAAVHVSAGNTGITANPAWYVTHLPSGHMQAVDSLTGTSSGLPASAGAWGADGAFYYAKEQSIWRAQPRTH